MSRAKRLWNRLSPVARVWSLLLAALGLLATISQAPSGAAVIAPLTPVLWFQLDTYIGDRSKNRDAQIVTVADSIMSQLDAIRADALENQISSLCSREDILFSRELMIDAQLKTSPNDVVAGGAKQSTDRQIQDERMQRVAAETALANLGRTQVHSGC